jgi:hypothetical protein
VDDAVRRVFRSGGLVTSAAVAGCGFVMMGVRSMVAVTAVGYGGEG